MNVSQHWEKEKYEQNARFVSTYGEELIRWLNPKKDEYILDLGCGDGVLTKRVAEYGCKVLGLDGSQKFVEAVRKIGVDAIQCDAQNMKFENEFDAIFSNAALHWMTNPDEVLKGVSRALKKGGRFVVEMGCKGNVEKIENAIFEVTKKHNLKAKKCWFFPSPEEETQLLEKYGLKVKRMVSFSRPTPLPTGIKGWLQTFSAPTLINIPVAMHEKLIDEITEKVEKELEKNENGQVLADYIRLRFEAVKI
ncbi:MAG: class I SAM-dependent methyltransferase [Neisseria sp.]|uniref:class I SAM-dependent methyltransferase n=1 Tax=Neisseria sp. TaxID=192066 RepID=UPI0026DA8E3F|nr:class I SAM-dependent methyltransferase [Neisseria sp.]MDO4640605.1 class I SAM-dependent methyltransferase [Neisseria sp.]